MDWGLAVGNGRLGSGSDMVGVGAEILANSAEAMVANTGSVGTGEESSFAMIREKRKFLFLLQQLCQLEDSASCCKEECWLL